MPESLP